MTKDKSLVSGDEHQILFEWLQKSKGKRIDIVAPWLSTANLERLIDGMDNSADVRIVVRSPQDSSELGFTDWDELKRVSTDGKAKIYFVDSLNALHAKVYRVQGMGAIVSSANFTGAGFSLKRAGNIELGTILSETTAVTEVDAWIETLPLLPLRENKLAELSRRASELRAWHKKAEKAIGPPPIVPTLGLGNHLEAKVIQQAIMDGQIDIEGTERGSERAGGHHLKYVFNIMLAGRRKPYGIKVRTSLESRNPPRDIEREYHFNLDIALLKSWKKTGGPVKGVVLVPLRESDDDEPVLANDPGACFLPFKFLFGPSTDQIAFWTFVASNRNGQSPTINLSKKINSNDWFIRCNFKTNGSMYKKEISLKGKKCFGETRLLKAYR